MNYEEALQSHYSRLEAEEEKRQTEVSRKPHVWEATHNGEKVICAGEYNTIDTNVVLFAVKWKGINILPLLSQEDRDSIIERGVDLW